MAFALATTDACQKLLPRGHTEKNGGHGRSTRARRTVGRVPGRVEIALNGRNAKPLIALGLCFSRSARSHAARRRRATRPHERLHIAPCNSVSLRNTRSRQSPRKRKPPW